MCGVHMKKFIKVFTLWIGTPVLFMFFIFLLVVTFDGFIEVLSILEAYKDSVFYEDLYDAVISSSASFGLLVSLIFSFILTFDLHKICFSYDRKSLAPADDK